MGKLLVSNGSSRFNVKLGMQIYFGLNLDGYHAPKAKPAFDELTCGPRGFLQLLETRLGLRSLPASSFQRVLQFRTAVVEAAKCQQVFFKESSEQDSLATARVLLQWRDELIGSGWNGSATETDQPRLRDLASLEKIVKAMVAPGESDRLSAVSKELETRSPGEIHLVVLDEKEHLPYLWQKVCDRLQARYAKDSEWSAKGATTDLARYQACLAGASAEKFKPKNDGSLLVLTAHSEITLARAVAQIIAPRDKKDRLTLIAGSQAGVLNQALIAEDEPLMGLQLRSSARPIPQLLILALRLCWLPTDPGALLEFLTHPSSPVGKLLRRHLSEALAASPGIGGPTWNEAVADARTFMGKLADKDEIKAALQKMDEDLERWILIERFNPETGAPGAKLSEFCMQLARWAAARSAKLDEDDIAGGHLKLLSSIASELAEVLVGYPTISRLELEQLLKELCSTGWEGEVFVPQLGHVTCAHHPQAVIDPVEQIIWWDFSEPSENKPFPWTKAEIQAFQSQGAHFISLETQAALKAKAWLRPMLAVKKQLILVLPKQRDGKPLTGHPLLARLLALTEGNPARLPTRDLDQELFSQKAMAPLVFTTLDHQPLPAPKRWWKLSDEKLLGSRGAESYSSLEKFIYKPFGWVLNYSAKLQQGPLTSLKLKPDFALKGTLLHRMLDLLLASASTDVNWLACTRPDLDKWCDRSWPTLLEQEGATLLLPGNLADNLSLLELAKRSLWELLQQLRAAKVASARTNLKPEDAPFIGGSIMGYIDLLVTNQLGRDAVVDLKLGGLARRQDELKTNRQLQLAIYGYLHHHSHKTWPEAAFYILGKQQLLAQAGTYFPKANLARIAVPQIGLENCWKDFETVWRWRRKQLDEGWIEVTTVNLAAEPDPSKPDSTPPGENWQHEPEDNNQYNDFDALTGWRVDQ
jgi:hypothetical protein